MKTPFVSPGKLLLAFIAGMSACLAVNSHAETVLDQTYYRAPFQNFAMQVYADHTDDGLTDDDPPSWGNSTLNVEIYVVVRDENGNVYSSSHAAYEFGGGEIEEIDCSEDIGLVFDPFFVEPHQTGYQAELYLDVDFSPPGTFQNTYSIEVLIVKYLGGDDDHEVDYTIW